LRYTDPTGHCVGPLTLLRPLCAKAAQKGIERATPYVAPVVAALAGAVIDSANTNPDPSCPACGRSYEMGQSMMKGDEQSSSQGQQGQQGQQQSQGQSNTASPNPGHNNDRSRTEKSIRSLENRVAEHEQKLADYKSNPDKYDNKGLLKNASPKTRQKIIQGRVRKLEREIRTFQQEITKLRESQ
jgi:hypothetical protein